MTIATGVQKANTGTGYVTPATHCSLHAGDPGSTGANELTGGAPPYARQPITWTDQGGGVHVSNELTFNIPAGTNVTHLGLWTAVTAGTFLDKGDAVITYAAQGVLKLTLTHVQD